MDKGLGDNGDRQRLVMVEISVVGPDRDFRRWVCVGVWENNKGKMKRKSQHKNEDKPSWLTHSKSISAQKIPTQSTLKPLGNQTHKSRKIYKSALKKKKKTKQFGQNPMPTNPEQSHAVRCQQWRRILRLEVLRWPIFPLLNYQAESSVQTSSVTNIHDVICLWVCELRCLVEKKAELVSLVVKSVGWRERVTGVKGKWKERKWWGMVPRVSLTGGLTKLQEWVPQKSEKCEWWEVELCVPNGCD